jgi:catechol 2,3-dioxygenase-like lactoylglutathione lyase family enzyme
MAGYNSKEKRGLSPEMRHSANYWSTRLRPFSVFSVITNIALPAVPTVYRQETVMKRFHVHLVVKDLEQSIGFYSQLFGQPPVKRREDYAKWMLEDPRVNFAISARGHDAGLDHFGFQVESPEELGLFREQAELASKGAVLDQGEAACCYSRSDKHWTIDPEGIAWEHFMTLADSPDFGEDGIGETGACCIPMNPARADASSAGSGCCLPTDEREPASSCCP